MPLDAQRIHDEKRDREALLHALRFAGCKVVGPNKIGCAWHDDKHPSAGTYQRGDGSWAFKCIVCEKEGDVYDVRRWNGEAKPLPATGAPALRLTTAKPESRPLRVFPTVAALVASVSHATDHFAYTDPDTRRVDLLVVRIEEPGAGKRFLQAKPYEEGFTFGKPDGLLPIYNRSRIRLAESVVVVEGERVVHSLGRWGIVATTSPMGAGKAALADWTPLAGKECVLWPDRDEKGVQHMKDVAGLLDALEPPCRVRWLDPDQLDLPTKGDATDFVEQAERDGCPHGTVGEYVRAILDGAEEMVGGAAGEALAVVRGIRDGTYRNIPWPWDSITDLTQSLLPGSVTMLVGHAGTTKSFMVLQAVTHWHEAGERVALLMMEDAREKHARRALAQRLAAPGLTRVEWIKRNAAQAERMILDNQDFMRAIGRIMESGDEKTSLGDIADWVVSKLEAGARIVVVDAVSVSQPGKDSWVQDIDFLLRVKRAAREKGASVVLVSHPRKGGKGERSLDEIAGAKCYATLVHAALWLHNPGDKKGAKITYRTPLGATGSGDCNRVLTILKARDGTGVGTELALCFRSDSLTSRELGPVVEDDDA